MGLIARAATLDETRQQAARKKTGWYRRDQCLTHHLAECAGSLLDHRAGKVIYPYNALGAGVPARWLLIPDSPKGIKRAEIDRTV